MCVGFVLFTVFSSYVPHIDMNATQAAIRAGHSKKTAAVIGTENLIKPNIKTEISRLQEEPAGDKLLTEADAHKQSLCCSTCKKLRKMAKSVQKWPLSEKSVHEL